MNIEAYLEFTRNHSSDCREIFSYADATLHAVNEGHIEVGIPALKLVLGGAYDNCITYINAMKDALDELE